MIETFIALLTILTIASHQAILRHARFITRD